jgi:hypothetical protein
MNPKDIAHAKSADLRASQIAIRRAAQQARLVAAQRAAEKARQAVLATKNTKKTALSADEIRIMEKAKEFATAICTNSHLMRC